MEAFADASQAHTNKRAHKTPWRLHTDRVRRAVPIAQVPLLGGSRSSSDERRTADDGGRASKASDVWEAWTLRPCLGRSSIHGLSPPDGDSKQVGGLTIHPWWVALHAFCCLQYDGYRIVCGVLSVSLRPSQIQTFVSPLRRSPSTARLPLRQFGLLH